MLDAATIQGFRHELLKIASSTAQTVEELKEELQPGDILYTRPRRFTSLGKKLFYRANSAIQGSPFTHVGMYVGDGKSVDAGEWLGKGRKDPTAVHKIGLKEYTDRYDFKVLRVSAPKKAKDEAVAFAKEQVGKDFNMKGMFRLAVPFFQGKAGKERPRKEGDNLFCSELVVNAYAPHKNIAKEKQLKHVKPGDIFRSPFTKTVMEFSKEKTALMKAKKMRRAHKPTPRKKVHRGQRLARMHKSWKLPQGGGQSK